MTISRREAVKRFGFYIDEENEQIVFAHLAEDGNLVTKGCAARPATAQELALYAAQSPFKEREVLEQLVNHLFLYARALEDEDDPAHPFEIAEHLDHFAKEAGISTMLAPPY